MDRKRWRAGVERVFGEQVEVQRWPDSQAGGNVKEYLPESCQKDYDRRMRNAYVDEPLRGGQRGVAEIFRQLERINPSAARSLEEGLEETLTGNRLGIGAVLRRKLPPPSDRIVLVDRQRVARNVKRWREGDQPLRWTPPDS